MSSGQGIPFPAAKSGELYSLKWDCYQGHFTQGLRRFFAENYALTDVTIGSEGQYIRSHKLVLSICSPYFKHIFESSSTQRDSSGAMMVLLEHIKFRDLKNVIHFIYNGEIKLSKSDLRGFLRAGELLQIEELVINGKGNGNCESVEPSPKKPATASSAASTQRFTQPGAGPSSSAGVAIPSSSSTSYSYPVTGHSGSSRSQPRPAKRTRLGRIIKPTIPDVEYDEDDEEEVDTIGGGRGRANGDNVTITAEGDMTSHCDDEGVDRVGAIGGTSNSNMSTFEEGHSSSDEDDAVEPRSRSNLKRIKRKFEWNELKTFATLEEGKKGISEERRWRYQCKRDTSRACTYFYNCKFSRQCNAKLKLTVSSSEPKRVALQTTSLPHNHLENENKKKLGRP